MHYFANLFTFAHDENLVAELDAYMEREQLNGGSGSTNGGGESSPSSSAHFANVILIGIMASGKSSIGQRLAYYLGFGFIDLDRRIEEEHKKKIGQIFRDSGEDKFRQIEQEFISQLSSTRNQVIAVGGGAVMNDQNWQALTKLGCTVWLNTPSSEVVRRIVMKPDEIRDRPLLADLVEIAAKDERQKKLTERLDSLIAQRKPRYSQAKVTFDVSYSTPETSAQGLKALLLKEGLIK